MDFYNFIKTDSGYEVTDSTRVQYRREYIVYHWCSRWSDDLKFEGITMNGQDVNKILSDKKDFDYHRVNRARSRHLGFLKEKFGLKPSKKSQKIPIYTLNKSIFSKTVPIEEKEGIIHPKTVETQGFMEKKSAIFYAPLTPERTALVKEYNQKLEEFIIYQKDVFAQIFGEDQVENWDV